MQSAWLIDWGVCGLCEYPIVVTSSQIRGQDYCWYCANPACRNHKTKTHTPDDQQPAWLRRVDPPEILKETMGEFLSRTLPETFRIEPEKGGGIVIHAPTKKSPNQ